MIRRFISAIGLLVLLTLPLVAQAREHGQAQDQDQERNTFTCSSRSSRTGTARLGTGTGTKSMGTIETQTQKIIRSLPCDVPDGISLERFEGSTRKGLDIVLAAINNDLKKKKQLTLYVDPAVEPALAERQARYLAGGYRVEDLLNNLCGGRCFWQFEEQEDERVLVVSSQPSAATP